MMADLPGNVLPQGDQELIIERSSPEPLQGRISSMSLPPRAYLPLSSGYPSVTPAGFVQAPNGMPAMAPVYPAQAPRRISSLAIASLICVIGGLALWEGASVLEVIGNLAGSLNYGPESLPMIVPETLGLSCLLVIGGIPAVFIGHFALSEIRRSGQVIAGRRMATIGLTLGYIEIAFFALGPALFSLSAYIMSIVTK